MYRGGSRGRVQGVRTPPEMTCGFLIQLVFCQKKKKKLVYWCWSQEQETSAPPPKRNPGSAPDVNPNSRFEELIDREFYCKDNLTSAIDSEAHTRSMCNHLLWRKWDQDTRFTTNFSSNLICANPSVFQKSWVPSVSGDKLTAITVGYDWY